MKHNKNILRAALLLLLVIVAPEARAQQLMTDNGDGTYTIIMPDNDVTVTADVKKLLANNDITVTIPSQTYTGSAIEPAVTVKDGETTLTLGTDYEVAYSNNVNAGTATATITGKGNYSGEKAATFTIAPKAVTNEDISITIPSQTRTGNELTPDIIVKDGETVLTLDEDYTVTAPSGPIQDSGNYTYTITGQGNYAGSREAMFTIADQLITADGQTISDATPWKNGLVSITGNSTVTFSERITISGTVTLNLGEGATLIASKGIEVDKGNTLTIEGNGALNATADKFYAAIGRGFHDSTSGTSGTININGGTITATGGRFAAAIGGGYEGVSGTINISGGTIVATGGYCAAGIGGGTFAACGVVNISGGQVTANGDRASGIGPGFDAGTSGTVTLGWTNESDGILASNYNDVETLRIAYGKAFTASTGNIYIGTLDDDQRAEFAGKTLKPVFCTGVMLTKESQGLTATIDGTSTATINIPTAITVDDVTYNRTFTDGKLSTVMLPFNKAVSEISGGTFYTFGGMKKENDKWVATMNEVTGSIEANTPYLVMPAGTSLTFSGGATLNTTCDGQAAEYDGFELRGTYTEKVWEENDPEIGKAYVYNDNGELIPVAAGTRIYPTECYIIQTKKLMTGTDITVTIPSVEWTGNEIAFDETAVVVKDGETTLTLTADYTVTAPTGTLQDTGDYPVTITGAGEYAGEVVAMFTIKGKPVTVKNDKNEDVPAATGDAEITQDQDGLTLTLTTPTESTTPHTVNVPQPVEVDHVTIDRTFEDGKACTLYLPFSIGVNKIAGGTFNTFVGVNTAVTPWEVQYSPVTTGEIAANTPYIFIPDGSNGGKIVVNNGEEKVTVCTANQHTTENGQWDFIGTYERIKWTHNTSDPEYDSYREAEIGSIYGFAAEEKSGATVGQFVQVTDNVWINPMRAYLKHTVVAPARSMDGDAATTELPSSMKVVIVAETTRIEPLSISPEGESTWYSIDGRKLQGKPTTKGIYINGNRKIVIK